MKIKIELESEYERADDMLLVAVALTRQFDWFDIDELLAYLNEWSAIHAESAIKEGKKNERMQAVI